ncbi:hypothetical protein KDA11_05350 [Candidatus Saccharibacteria bacterium]|nr:hypothetical protein [Candidatus Saccharibacteria bacterium]
MPKLTKQLKQPTNIRVSLYLSACLLACIFNFRVLQPLVFIGLVPLVFYVDNLRLFSDKQRRIDFYLFGGIITCGANFFMMQISSTNWNVGIRGWFAVAAPIIAWLMISSFCALAWLALGEVLANPKVNRYRLVTLAPFYALCEILKSYLFSAMAYAPHGSLSPNFNWGSLAVPASATNILVLSPYVGFFGLSLVCVMLNIAIYVAIKKSSPGLFILLITTFLLSFWPMNLVTKTSKITTVNDKNVKVIGLEPDQTLANWDKQQIAKNIPEESLDLIVLPEYSGILDNPNYKDILKHLSDEGIVVTSVHSAPAPTGQNNIIFINKQGEIINTQSKTFLIPTGETLPYSLQLVFKLMGRQDIITSFTYTQQISPGTKQEDFFEYAGTKYGALACSGVSALSQYRRLSNQGADVLVNSASLSFLQKNSTYHVYADNMARFQAVSNKKPFIQASRSGSSFILVPQ